MHKFKIYFLILFLGLFFTKEALSKNSYFAEAEKLFTRDCVATLMEHPHVIELMKDDDAFRSHYAMRIGANDGSLRSLIFATIAERAKINSYGLSELDMQLLNGEIKERLMIIYAMKTYGGS